MRCSLFVALFFSVVMTLDKQLFMRYSLFVALAVLVLYKAFCLSSLGVYARYIVITKIGSIGIMAKWHKAN